MIQVEHQLTFVAALGSGLIAGVFFAFSTFVMKALSRLPTAQGIAAMQLINVVVINPLFLGTFMGTAALSCVLIVTACVDWNVARGGWLVSGSMLYLIGTFGVTLNRNVPLNNRLEKMPSDDPAAESIWIDYVRRWTFWNHVRTAAALAACAAFIVSVCR